jgi:hypothetical protein
MNTTIAIHPFVRRQTKKSPFSYTTLSDEELLDRVRCCLEDRKSGYRDGVFLVPVDPEGFFTAVVALEPGDGLRGVFETRRDGELARKQVYGPGSKKPAVKVDIVLYRYDVLEENKERSSDAEFEIVSLNAYPTEEESPLEPETLMANFFQDPGASNARMTDAEFVVALQESRRYWRDKAMTAPEDLVPARLGDEGLSSMDRIVELIRFYSHTLSENRLNPTKFDSRVVRALLALLYEEDPFGSSHVRRKKKRGRHG